MRTWANNSVGYRLWEYFNVLINFKIMRKSDLADIIAKAYEKQFL